MTLCTTIDFETAGIDRRPAYPPVPVGFSIKRPGERKSVYHAWGHPTKNNTTKEQAQRILKAEFKQAQSQSGSPLLFQNGKFDVDVAQTHMDCPDLRWDAIHDTMYLIYLHDPHALTFSLKPTAARLLDMPPGERDAVKDWVLEHVPECKRKKAEWGRYICRAPGDLVGRYADGDVIRTEKLFNLLHPQVSEAGMLEAYNRERELMPILLGTERAGIRCNVDVLRKDLVTYQFALEQADRWLRKALNRPNLNLDADKDVGDALNDAGIVTEWVMTKMGKRSVAKKNMKLEMFNDSKIAAVFGYRTRCATAIRMFMETWLGMAEASGGLIFTNWNQVRQDKTGGTAGARTGRLSSNPNFQNVPTAWEDKGDGYTHPQFPIKLMAQLAEIRYKNLRREWPIFLPELPTMRKYFLPDIGHTWIKRDYSQQEIRLLAHFEDGSLLQKYLADPDYDLHADVQAGIKQFAGLELKRGPVKILNFGDIYGMGYTSFFEKTGIDRPTYKKICDAKAKLLPDLEALNEAIKNMGKTDQPIRTWGGRVYYCEKATYVEKHKRYMTFEYKLLNYLIQGSAADVTKQAVINYHNHPKRTARFLLTVHDELNASSPKREAKRELEVMREAMSDINTDIEMKSDPCYGPNWGDVAEIAGPKPNVNNVGSTGGGSYTGTGRPPSGKGPTIK